MAFCPNCGKETALGAAYCASCGRPLQGAPQTPPYAQAQYYSKKEEGIAAILSLIIPGVGQMYVGRIVRGIVIFLAPPIFFFLVVLPIFMGSVFTTIVSRLPAPPNSPLPMSYSIFAFPFIFLFLIVLWLGFLVWNVYDAYNLARIYNHQLMTTGRPPW